MKKMLFLLLLVLFLVPAMAFAGADIKDETLPESLREYFSSDSFNGYTIGENASRIFDNTSLQPLRKNKISCMYSSFQRMETTGIWY